jgi:hypothetical protein
MIISNSEEFDETSGDVITSEALRGGDISRAAVVNDTTDSSFELFSGGLLGATSVDLVVAPGNSFLGSHTVPDTITGQKNESATRVNWHNFDIGEGSDGLVFGLHASVALVLEVTEGTGKSKGSVDTTIFDKTIGVVDALTFFGIIRLVILG